MLITDNKLFEINPSLTEWLEVAAMYCWQHGMDINVGCDVIIPDICCFQLRTCYRSVKIDMQVFLGVC